MTLVDRLSVTELTKQPTSPHQSPAGSAAVQPYSPTLLVKGVGAISYSADPATTQRMGPGTGREG